MKRNRFLVAMAATLLAPAQLLGRQVNRMVQQGKGFVAKAGEGRYHGHIHLKGVNNNIQDVKVSGQDNGGALAIFEQTGLSPGRGVPLHLHHNQDEIFMVLEGEYHFLLGTERYRLKAGDAIFMPRKIPHAWLQVSQRGKTNVLVQPAGKLEAFFVTVAALKKEPSKEEMVRLFADHDMKVMGPPMQME